jgi:SOS-response transcriptional repressor LexA
VKAAPGDHVIVQLPSAVEAVFKTLEFDGQHYFLKPLNSRYPISEMPSDARVVGVVVSVQNHQAITPRSRL